MPNLLQDISVMQKPKNPFEAMLEQYPGLKRYGLKFKDSSSGGYDWRGAPYAGRQLEFYPPDEEWNPYKGSPTIEMFNPAMKTSDLFGEIFSHHLPKVDPEFMNARSQFVKSIDEKQKKLIYGDYQDQLRAGLFGQKRPTFDQWLNEQGGDAFFRGYVTDQYPKEFYRQDQIDLFNNLMKRFK